MEIERAQVPMGPGSDGAVLELLRSHLDPSSAGFEAELRALAGRVDQDLGRLPWTRAILLWLESQDAIVVQRTLHLLKHLAASDPRPGVARGAALLLVTMVDQTGEASDELLFDLVAAAREAEVQRLVGAYLLATARTRSRALAELDTVPALSDLVDHQRQVSESFDVWRNLLNEVAAGPDSAYAEIVLNQVESRPDLQFELANGCLDVFERLGEKQRRGLIRFWLDALERRGEQVQVFVCDLLTDPVFLEAVRRAEGYRLERFLWRLERTAESPRVRQYATALLARMETSATAAVEMAARGRLGGLSPSRNEAIALALLQAAEWFREQDVTTLATIRETPSWDPGDYAHAALQLLGQAPRFPVDLGRLCRRLGVFLRGVDLPPETDGLVIQRPGLPGPVVLYNLRATPNRRRFTIAHEVGHAVLPGHAAQMFHVSSVVEAAEPVVLDRVELEAAATVDLPADPQLEREADRFAAALLMPPRWFGDAVRRESLTLAGLERLAQAFGVSLTAAAFQAARHTREAVAVVYSVSGRVRFQRMTDEFREAAGYESEVLSWVRPGTGAAELLDGSGGTAARQLILPAALWLSGTRLAEVREESLRTVDGHVLSIITPVDDE